MKIDENALDVAIYAARGEGWKNKREMITYAITAYLKETQPTAEVEPSCDVVEYWRFKEIEQYVAIVINNVEFDENHRFNYLLNSLFSIRDKLNYALSALQQKPKAEVNELVGKINEAIKLQELAKLITEWEGVKHLKLLASINAHPESKDVLEICEGMIKACELLTKCKNFIEGK
jgi:hypothetical protein